MNDKVQFQTNVPVEIALKYDDGKEVNGQYGDQVMYTLTDGRVMYVPPIVKRRIDELGIGRGELFTLTKAEKKNGTRRTIEWLVAIGERGERVARTRDQQVTGRERRNGAAGEVVAGNGHAPRPSVSGDAKGFLVTGQGSSCCRLSLPRWMQPPRRNAMRQRAAWSCSSRAETCARSG